MAKTPYKKAITIDNLNPGIVKLEYAIYGPMLKKLKEISKELENGDKKPYNRVISANIGDCHALGQVPITFIRQVIACISYPKLMDNDNFPDDVKSRALELLNACSGSSIGSYPSSIGIESIRRSVASYIERRDGYAVDWENICLCPGASSGIKASLQMLAYNINGRPSGVMIPIPQYPLYSASVVEYSLTQGGMYAFPSLKLPPKAIIAAEQEDLEPDMFYAMKLLEETGVCVVPGCGFGQKPGTYHFRTTILPQIEALRDMVVICKKFHKDFLLKYS